MNLIERKSVAAPRLVEWSRLMLSVAAIIVELLRHCLVAAACSLSDLGTK
jgi:hypothetical protein